MTAKKEVTKKQDTALALTGVDMEADGMGESGFEECDADSFAVPFLRILQQLSPQVDKNKAEYVEGAEPGQFFNSATAEIYGTNIILVPCHYRRKFIEWKPKREGLVAVYDVAEGTELLKTATRNDKGQDILPNGNSLSDTREHFVLVINPETGTVERAIVAMSSTQIKKSKQWMTKMQTLKVPRKDDPAQKYTPPMYSHIYKAIPVYESNDQGSWHGWGIALDGPVTDAALYNEAKEFRASVVEGRAKVDHGAAEGAVTEEDVAC